MKTLSKLISIIGGISLALNVATAKAETLSGKVVDAVTDQPIENISVIVDNQFTNTNEQGDYSIETDQGLQRFRITDGLENYFNYDEEIDLTTDTLKNVWMIPIRGVDTRYYPDFLYKFKYLARADNPFNTNKRIYQWVPLPIPVYYNEEQAFQVFEEVCAKYPNHCPYEGAEFLAQQYFNACDLALQDWEEKSGVDLFQRVYEDTGYGVKIDYSDDNSVVRVSDYIGKDPYFYPVFAELFIDHERYLLTPNRLRDEYIHELGHCIRLSDTPKSTWLNPSNPPDIMNPSRWTTEISQNEADIVKIMYTLPNWTDMRNYNSETYNAVKSWDLYE